MFSWRDRLSWKTDLGSMKEKKAEEGIFKTLFKFSTDYWTWASLIPILFYRLINLDLNDHRLFKRHEYEWIDSRRVTILSSTYGKQFLVKVLISHSLSFSQQSSDISLLRSLVLPPNGPDIIHLFTHNIFFY